MKMRKVLCMAMAMTMVTGMLAGCGDKKDNETTAPPESTVTDTSKSEPEESTVVEPEAEVVTVGSKNERLAYVIDSLRENDERKEVFVAQTTNENGALDLLTLNETDLEEYSLTFSMMNVHAYMVAVMKPVEGKEETVKEAFNLYQKSVEKSFEQYLPDQYAIALEAVSFEHNGYIGFVMCENRETFEKDLKAALDKIDEIKVIGAETSGTEATEGKEDIGVTDGTESTESTDGTDEAGKKIKDTDVNKATKATKDNKVNNTVKNTPNSEASEVTE